MASSAANSGTSGEGSPYCAALIGRANADSRRPRSRIPVLPPCSATTASWIARTVSTAIQIGLLGELTKDGAATLHDSLGDIELLREIRIVRGEAKAVG